MQIETYQLPNGLTVLVESMPWLESAAFALLLPGGCGYEETSRAGLASLTCEMVQRGAGPRDSRQFLEDLELLGVEFSSSVTSSHMSFGASMPAENLGAALELYADLARRPHLDDEQLDDARQGCLQEVRAVEDDLAQKTLLQLRARYYPDPHGRASHGTEQGLEAIERADVVRHFQRAFVPREAMLSVAGKIDPVALRGTIERLFGDWSGAAPQLPAEVPPPRGYEHLLRESSQTHIGVAYPSVSYADPKFYEARAGVGILSDGMSSRLFTEVREKRGLCYSVFASCYSLRDRGSVMCYAGTTAERAQETLDVLVGELDRLCQGVDADEVRRLQSRLKSSLIMQQESSASRAGAMAMDWYYLGRVLTLDELGRIVAGLTVEKINDYLATHPPGELTVVTLGNSALMPPANRTSRG